MHFKNNLLFLAPMAGITDPVFRTICREQGADVVVSEMVSVNGILYGAEPTMDLMRFEEFERPIGVQLFGSDPEHFKRAAAIATQRFAPDFIDINAGCPVQKVVRKNGGSSLLRNLKVFGDIVAAAVEESTRPVTVKLRSGWQKYDWVDVEFAQCAEERGAAAVILHPRSQTMMFSGHSYWERIGAVKKSVSIPVIGNGDITCGSDAVTMVAETSCDGLMIGRASYGNPWIFSEIKAAFSDAPFLAPTNRQKGTVALRHLNLFLKQYGERRTIREMKKHVAWYVKGMPGASLLRDRIFRAESSSELRQALQTQFSL